jgi:hypothetical protein
MNRVIAFIAVLTVLLPIEEARAVAPVIFDEKLPTIDKVIEGDSSINRSVDAHGFVHYRICMVGKISPGGVVKGHVDGTALCLSDEAGNPILMAPIVISHTDSKGRPDENSRSISFSLSKQLEKRAVLNLGIDTVMRVSFFAFRLSPPKTESPEPSTPPNQ